MSQLQNTNGREPVSGDGIAATTEAPQIARVNDQFKSVALTGRGKERKPKLVDYTNRDPEQVVQKELEAVAMHKSIVDSDEDGDFAWKKVIKAIGLIALAIGGAAVGAAWTDAHRMSADPVIHQALKWSTIIGLITGPIYMWRLTEGMEKGLYRGVEKGIAIFLTVVIFGDEVLTLLGKSDPVFADFFMRNIAPYVTPFLLIGATVQLIMRSSKRRLRNLMHMQESQGYLQSKEQFDEQMDIVKKKRTARNMGKVSFTLSRWRVAAYTFVITAIYDTFTDMGRAWELAKTNRARIPRMVAEDKPAKKPARSTAKKARAAGK